MALRFAGGVALGAISEALEGLGNRPDRDETSGDAKPGGLAQYQRDHEERMESSQPGGTDEEQIGDHDSGSPDP